MPFFEISVESCREKIRKEDCTIAEADLGTWIVKVLDVDWEALEQETCALMETYPHLLPDLLPQYAKKAAKWYWSLQDRLSQQHPLLKLLVENRIYYHLAGLLMPDTPNSPEEKNLQYLDALRQRTAVPRVSHNLLKEWLQDAATLFHAMAQMKASLLGFLDAATAEEPKSVEAMSLQYLSIQQNSPTYLKLSELCHTQLKVSQKIEYHGKFYYPMELSEKSLAAKQKERKVVECVSSDQLDAITFWLFEKMCGQGIILRRCHHCGRYFLPYSVVSCYCSRPVSGMAGKTCKDIGAMLRYQDKTANDEAKHLYTKARTQLRNYAKRNRLNHPGIEEKLQRALAETDTLLEQYHQGQLSDEEYANLMTRRSWEWLGIPQ